jgi:TonB-linked SusC/RagA family outer membrane protein
MKKLAILFVFILGTNLLFAQQFIIGHVYNAEDKASLPGVSVVNKNTSEATVTNQEGFFRISAKLKDELEFRFIGMETLFYQVKDLSEKNIFLSNSYTKIDEVLIIGYGESKKSQFTGSSVKLKNKTFQNSNFASIDKMLQAEAPGLMAIHQSGDPTSKASVFIRGFGSISADYAPLYILDGLPISADQFVSLNPNDIENVSVLKDASSISIYGSKGSNGVIILSSKKAKKNRFHAKFRLQLSYSDVVKDKLNMMNAEEKLRYEKQLGLNNLSEESILKKAQNQTDWKDEIFRQGVTKSGSLELSNSNERSSYFLSFSYFNQKGIVLNSHLKKYTSRVNLNHEINKKIKVYFNASLTHRNAGHADGITSKKVLKNSPIVQAYLNNPYDLVKDKNGNFLNTTLGPNAIEDLTLSKNINKQNNLVLHTGASIRLAKNIKLDSKFGIEYRQNILDKYNHPNTSLYRSLNSTDLKGELSRGYNGKSNLNQSHTLHFDLLSVAKHKLNGVIGFENSKFESDDFFVVGKGFGDGELRTLKSASKASNTTGDKVTITSLSYFSRLNYQYDSKLYLDFTFRRDASSVFGKDKQYGNFYSIGAAYNAQKLINLDQLDYLKLRASLGTSGNSSIPAYSALSIYSYTQTYNNIPAVRKSQLSNKDLTWEKCLSYNAGMDISVFDSSLSLSLDFYKRITSDLLINYEISRTNGFTSLYKNAGEIVNKGVEMSLAYQTNLKANFKWNTKLNLAYNKNEITHLPKDIQMNFTILREGEALGTLYAVEYAGVNPANGNPMWYNNEGVPTEDFNIKYAKTQKPGIPPLNGGFFNRFHYKSFGFAFDIIFAYGNEIFNNAKYFTNSDGEFSSYNQNRDLLYKQWKKVGDKTDVPRQVKGAVNNQYSTKYIEDGSYLKLKNIELFYNLPSTMTQKLGCSNVQIFVKGNNLLTITKYTGFDPELASTIDAFRYPTTKTISLGVNANF